MNTEREKTDALSDAVEIDNNKPEGATHTEQKPDSIVLIKNGVSGLSTERQKIYGNV